MLRWFTINDVVAGYSISKSKLTKMCKNGEIGTMRVRDKRHKGNRGQYLIPECELLVKLAEYKVGEPLYKEEHQPSEDLIWRNDAMEAECMEKLTGDYKAYLQSEHWQNVRMQALKRDGLVCQLCGSGINSRVHHVSYDRVGSDEEVKDLVTLCEECHSKVHVKDKFTREGQANMRLIVAAPEMYKLFSECVDFLKDCGDSSDKGYELRLSAEALIARIDGK